MTRLRHGMCCCLSTSGAASSPSSGYSAPARASSGLPWPLPLWPVPQPRFVQQTPSPQTMATWTCALRSGATALPSAAAPSVRCGLASQLGRRAGGHNPLCSGKKSKGLSTLPDEQEWVGARYTKSWKSLSAKPLYRFKLPSVSYFVTLSKLVPLLWILF